jgi:hypothetical protein
MRQVRLQSPNRHRIEPTPSSCSRGPCEPELQNSPTANKEVSNPADQRKHRSYTTDIKDAFGALRLLVLATA